MIMNITEQAFADSVCQGALVPNATDFAPVFQIKWAAISGGSASNFPAIYPARFGLSPMRAWVMNPSSDSVEILATFTCRLLSVASMGAPTNIRALLGLNVFEIKDQNFIDQFMKEGIGYGRIG